MSKGLITKREKDKLEGVINQTLPLWKESAKASGLRFLFKLTYNRGGQATGLLVMASQYLFRPYVFIIKLSSDDIHIHLPKGWYIARSMSFAYALADASGRQVILEHDKPGGGTYTSYFPPQLANRGCF